MECTIWMRRQTNWTLIWLQRQLIRRFAYGKDSLATIWIQLALSLLRIKLSAQKWEALHSLLNSTFCQYQIVSFYMDKSWILAVVKCLIISKVPLLLIGYENNKIEINIKLHNETDNTYKVYLIECNPISDSSCLKTFIKPYLVLPATYISWSRGLDKRHWHLSDQ